MEKIRREERHVGPMDNQIERPMRGCHKSDDNGASPSPERPTDSPENCREYKHSYDGMSVVGVNDRGAIPMTALRQLHRLNASDKQRHEYNVQSHRSQHQHPEWRAALPPLYQRCEPKVSGDHDCLLLLVLIGHGNRESTAPTTTTNRKTPRTNCIRPPSLFICSVRNRNSGIAPASDPNPEGRSRGPTRWGPGASMQRTSTPEIGAQPTRLNLRRTVFHCKVSVWNAHARPCPVLRGRKSGYALSKNISRKGPRNCRSLGCARDDKGKGNASMESGCWTKCVLHHLGWAIGP
jgi:hypothetical protein